MDPRAVAQIEIVLEQTFPWTIAISQFAEMDH